MSVELPSPTAPLFAFHQADFSLADNLWRILVLVLFGAMFVGLPAKEIITAKGPPEVGLVVIWLLTGGLIWLLGHGLLSAWLGMRREEKAGLRVAEGEDYLEVAFFVGARPYQIQRFAYSEISGCGVGTFFDAVGNPRSRPYVAQPGLAGGISKTMIPLAILQDARQISAYRSYDIAVDLDRIIRRHCDLPPPEVPMSVIADEKEQELLRHAAQVVDRLNRERALRQSRFLGQDWPRIGLSLTATALLSVLWLDDEIGLRWDDDSDWLVVAILFYGFYRLAGAILNAWRQREQPRDRPGH